jgi:hypothetical protein
MWKARPKKGKILRVKEGYNPNSSSMGSIIFALPISLLVVTVGLGAVSSLILSLSLRAKGPHGREPSASESPDDET